MTHKPPTLIARTRDRMAHGYFDINLDRVWEMVTNDLLPLRQSLAAIPLLDYSANAAPSS